MTASDRDDVGSIADEAFKLFRAVAGAPGETSAVHDDGHVCSASWCPLCRVVGFVRDNPDALTAVTHSATALALSLRDLVEQALAPQEKT